MIVSTPRSGRRRTWRYSGRETRWCDLHRLLVPCAHIILGPISRDSDLRRHGLKIMRPDDKVSRRKAAVTVARKLAMLLHSLWSSGEVYEPLRNSRTRNPSPPTQSTLSRDDHRDGVRLPTDINPKPPTQRS